VLRPGLPAAPPASAQAPPAAADDFAPVSPARQPLIKRGTLFKQPKPLRTARLFGVHPAMVSRLLQRTWNRVLKRTLGFVAPQTPSLIISPNAADSRVREWTTIRALFSTTSGRFSYREFAHGTNALQSSSASDELACGLDRLQKHKIAFGWTNGRP
jgi:hypothetical protein